MSYFSGRKAAKPFAFDYDYRSSESSGNGNKSSEKGLVSFFDDEPVDTSNRRTEWSATPVTEEDLREGMDDYKKTNEEDTEDIKNLIAAMPHNVSKSSSGAPKSDR